MKPLSLLLCAVLLAGCGGGSVDRHASSLIPVVHAQADPCAGNNYGAKESPGSFVQLVNCPAALLGDPNETDTQTLTSAGKSNVVSIVTTADLHVRAIRLWIGAGVGSRFESGVNLEIIPPGGQGYKRFLREWDKHVEEHFDDQPFAVDFIVPAGSTIRLSRDPHSAGPCNDGLGCLTQEGAELFGN